MEIESIDKCPICGQATAVTFDKGSEVCEYPGSLKSVEYPTIDLEVRCPCGLSIDICGYGVQGGDIDFESSPKEFKLDSYCVKDYIREIDDRFCVENDRVIVDHHG